MTGSGFVSLRGWTVAALGALAACGGGGSSVATPPTAPAPPPPAAGPPPAPTTGTLRVEIRTTGARPDADGYTLALDGGTAAPLAIDSNTSFAALPAGTHRLSLSSLDCNCSTTAANPATVDLAGGEDRVVRFDVTCPDKAAQPQPVALATGVLSAFELMAYGEQMVIVGARQDSALRASALTLGLMNRDANLPQAIESVPVVADRKTTGGPVQVQGTAVRVLSEYTLQCLGCMPHPGIGFSMFSQPFTGAATQTTADYTTQGSSTGLRQALALAGGLALYQTGESGDRQTFASRYGFAGTPDTIVPISTSRNRLAMALATSPSSTIATALEAAAPLGISTQPLTTDGLPTGTPVTLETQVPTVVRPAGAAIAWCGDRFATAWWAQSSVVNGRAFMQLRGRVLDAAGSPLAATVALTPPIDFTTEQEVKPIALSCLEGTGFAVAYVDPSPAIQLITTDLDLAATGSRSFATLTGVADGTGAHLVVDAKQFGVGWRAKGADAFYFSRACRAP